MTTVLRSFGWRWVIYPNDHRPAHVHVIGDDREAVFNLHCPKGPAELRENYGFSRRDLRRIEDECCDKLDALCSAWRQIHGH